MAPRVGEEFIEMKPPLTGEDRALGLVDFSIFPHVDNPGMPENAMAYAERWAERLGNPSYAIDDETAIRVVDGRVDVVSAGHWKRFGD
jgi:dipeptidase E